MRRCNRQITTADGLTHVTMRSSGERVGLGRCGLRRGHYGDCGRMEELNGLETA